MEAIENRSQLEIASAEDARYLSAVTQTAVARTAVSMVDALLADSCAQLQDQLFDLRASLLTLENDPALSVETFLRLRPLLARKSYLTSHRLRRLLEAAVEVEVTTPAATIRRPLDLSWSSLDRLLAAHRRSAFEHSDWDWSELSARLVSR